MAPLLEAADVRRHYGRHREVRAVDGVHLAVTAGESVGIAGESGSGKSTLLRLLLCLEPPSAGTIRFDGSDVQQLRAAAYRRYRAQIQAVFQDPGGSMNPRHRVWRVITEPWWAGTGARSGRRRELAAELLTSVELPASYIDKFPHELSGGERQRVAIARALSPDPRLVLLDEPVTSLDISVRGHIINLLNDKARSAGLTYVVVSHDLTAIFHLTERLFVMRHGLVVESGPTVDVIDNPLHPYTRTLVAAVDDPLAAQISAAEQDEVTDTSTSSDRRACGALVPAGSDRFVREDVT
ncbi:ABC transporter ATP-binding protein [Pseudonocardia nigra]|uniref:ABC transporter ATP-binding protein n=1 Tax=Pseudonocardia nigra TaxID=1921578 RepID=UPI001C5FDFAA|nr:ABC transporter ATP-binding protein [Pseudonocardia nigra]